jgi:hypothetical protein
MRAGAVLVVVVCAVIVAVCALTLAGKLPWVSHHVDTLASAWEATSADAAPGDGGQGEGGDPPVKPQAAPLTSSQLSAPLYHVTFLSECGAPPDMHVSIKVTVKMGKATDVQVSTDPPDPGISDCIDRATRQLRWPPSRRTDHVSVKY